MHDNYGRHWFNAIIPIHETHHKGDNSVKRCDAAVSCIEIVILMGSVLRVLWTT